MTREVKHKQIPYLSDGTYRTIHHPSCIAFHLWTIGWKVERCFELILPLYFRPHPIYSMVIVDQYKPWMKYAISLPAPAPQQKHNPSRKRHTYRPRILWLQPSPQANQSLAEASAPFVFGMRDVPRRCRYHPRGDSQPGDVKGRWVRVDADMSYVIQKRRQHGGDRAM